MRASQQIAKSFAVLTTSVVGAAIVFSAVGSSGAAAQSSLQVRRNSISIEANPFRGSLSWARAASQNWEVGAGAGFGFPQIDVTLLRGKRDDFRDYFHVSGIARRHYGKRALLELSARVGFADYQPCLASDCWPKFYIGPSALFVVGGEHLKIGPRFTFGEISSPSGDLDVFASVSPVNVFVSWRW